MAKGKNILITGAAGFIGFHLSKFLCQRGYRVVGIDNLNDYYDVDLKLSRLAILQTCADFSFAKLDLIDKAALDALFSSHDFSRVVNLAAQAGVRYSILNPHAYLHSNLQGFLNVLEACRHSGVKHLLYASSSSVYGANKKVPFSTKDPVDHPISLYAATKKSNELMAHTYSSLFGIPTTGLRFFTVYGPYGRPDMAMFLFTKAILEGRPINIFNNGNMKRDFTYIDDIVEAISRLLDHIPKGADQIELTPATSFAPYRLYNIGNNNPVNLMDFIEAIERKLGKAAIRNYMPIQEGDVPVTYADIDDLEKEIGFRPGTPIEVGVSKFVDWYCDYYKVNTRSLG